MCHELMLPYVAPFKDDYHIIAPDLTGHVNDKGQFISAEKDAEELASWLSANGMREIDLMFSSSLGGVVAMYLATSKEDIHIKCNVMEGASLTRVPLIEPLFRIMMDGIRKNPEKIAKMYASMPMMDGSIQTKLYNAMKRTDEQALRNMVHTCNSFDFENRSLDEKKTKNSGIRIWKQGLTRCMQRRHKEILSGSVHNCTKRIWSLHIYVFTYK